MWWHNSPHMLWSEHEEAPHLGPLLKPYETLWLTWLRHPVTRVVSEYMHALAENVRWDYTLEPNASLLTFVSDERFAVGASNRMVRMLGGGVRPLDGTSGPTALALAKRRLDSTRYFGLFERLRESLWLLRVTFPAARLPSLKQERIDASDGSSSSLRSSFTLPGVHSPHELSEVMVRLREANALDSALYAYAEGVFEQRLGNISCTNAVSGVVRTWHTPRERRWRKRRETIANRAELLHGHIVREGASAAASSSAASVGRGRGVASGAARASPQEERPPPQQLHLLGLHRGGAEAF